VRCSILNRVLDDHKFLASIPDLVAQLSTLGAGQFPAREPSRTPGTSTNDLVSLCVLNWSPDGNRNCTECADGLFRLAADNYSKQRNAPDMPEAEYARIDMDDQMDLYVRLFAEDQATVVAVYHVTRGNRVRLCWVTEGEAKACGTDAWDRR
jgi:hypothetical protein